MQNVFLLFVRSPVAIAERLLKADYHGAIFQGKYKPDTWLKRYSYSFHLPF